jgi:non-specific serine/threonine protein kinase
MANGGSMSFGVALRQRRIAAGLTQELLAERSGVGLRSIQGLERDETRPRHETVRRLVDALGLSAEEAASFGQAGQPQPRRRPVPSLSATTPSRRLTARSARHNLPVQLTSFVGREGDLAELTARLRSAHLLTLTGTGGCGKTRLALQVAAGVMNAYPDGTWLVELAGLADPGMVDRTVAVATGVRESAGQPVLTTLLESLRTRRLLLVLDNCEHLIDACATLADAILRACPGIRILATSREPLAIDGEVTWRVPSLAVAPVERMPRPDDLLAYEAPRLFVERAVAAQPAFTLTSVNATAVAQICRRLDGIPLAIELGARRVTALSAEQIAERLDQRFHLLTGGSRAALPRQQTLAATVEWSYTLLSEAERTLFDRLAVFAGGFTLEAAEAVASAGAGSAVSGIARQAPGTLETLTRLVEKSLVLAEVGVGGSERYRLLETLRQYARERLVEASDLATMQRRHAVYFADLAGKASNEIMEAGQTVWLDHLDRDHDNLSAAVRWAIEHQDAELALRLAASLSYFWYFRGYQSEGRALRAAVLALPAGPELATLRVTAIQGEGLQALLQGDYAAARAIMEEGVAIGRAGERALLPPTLATLGFVARVQDDYETGRAVLDEAIVVARAVGDAFYLGMALHHLGLLALEAERDLARAWSLNEEAQAILGELGNRRMVGVVRLALGRVAHARGDLAEARSLAAGALTAHRDLGDVGYQPLMLCVLAAIDADAGQLERAVRLAGAAAILNEAMRTRTWPVILRERDSWLGRARSSLGEERHTRAWAEGAALTLEQAVAYALGTAVE